MTRAATRDASFYRRPDVRSPKVYHVIGERGMSACGRLVYDNPETPEALADSVDAATVGPGMRCQRPGCKARWPAYDPARTYVAAGVTTCRKCGGAMAPGKAMGQTMDCGDEGTCSPAGPGKLIDCMKCSACGWSVTAGLKGKTE